MTTIPRAPRALAVGMLTLALGLTAGVVPASAQVTSPTPVVAQGQTAAQAVQFRSGVRFAGSLPAAPPNGSSVSNNGAGLAFYKFDYPGDNSLVTISMQVSPDNAVHDQSTSFVVYGPRSKDNPGFFYATGGDQSSRQPNISGDFRSTEKATYLIQVYNDNRFPVSYTIWSDNLPLQLAASTTGAASAPQATAAPATVAAAPTTAPTSVGAATGAPVKVHLSEEGGSGIFAEVTLTPLGNRTRVQIASTGSGTGPQPALIFKGTCFNFDPASGVALNNVVNGVSDTTINVPLSTLQATPMAIDLYKSPQESSVYVACGNIPLVRGAAAAAAPATTPTVAASPLPVVPSQLPRTGDPVAASGLALLGGLTLLAGARLRGRRTR